MIKSRQPQFIKETNFRFNTGWLDIDYFGIEEKNITLTIRVFNSDYYYDRTAAMGVKKRKQHLFRLSRNRTGQRLMV